MGRLFFFIFVVLLTLTNFAQSEEKIMLNKGIDAYKDGNFNLALEHFNNGYKTNGDYKKALFNAGNAALLNDSTEIAKDLFSEYVSIANNKAEKNKGYYNLGNVQYKAYESLTENPEKSQEAIKTLKESIESYKDALRNNPKDQDARHNLRLAMSKLPPPNENQDQQNQDQQNQNQQNQDQNQDQQNQENQQNENKDGQDKEGENQKDGEKGEDKEGNNKEGEQGDQQKDSQGNKEEEQKDGEQKGKQGEEGNEKGEEEMKGQISRMQAAKDLDALNNDEQKTLMKVNRKKGDQKQQNSSSKDW